MRVVGGKFRGRPLAGPNGKQIRPTADRLRESLFNILTHAYDDPIAGGRVLDLFDIESGLVKRWKGGRQGARKPRPNAK